MASVTSQLALKSPVVIERRVVIACGRPSGGVAGLKSGRPIGQICCRLRAKILLRSLVQVLHTAPEVLYQLSPRIAHDAQVPEQLSDGVLI